jgi:hypothetical protein
VRTIDTVLAELVDTRAELDVTDDAARRALLRDRLHRLRAEAAAVRGPRLASMTDDEVRAEIARCDRLSAALRAARYDPSMVGGASGRGGGLDPVQTIAHNRAVDEAGGRAELEVRRVSLVEELTRRHER